MSKLPDWFLWKRCNWKTVGLQAMSLPYDISTKQVDMEVKDLYIPFPVSFPNQPFLYVSIYSYFVNKISSSLYLVVRFSPTCFLGEDGQPTCDACPPGYGGRRCDR